MWFCWVELQQKMFFFFFFVCVCVCLCACVTARVSLQEELMEENERQERVGLRGWPRLVSDFFLLCCTEFLC